MKLQPLESFEGFEPANTTPVPDVLFDRLLPYLNEAQLKVMLYIIRRTLGFKKTADAISFQQFRYGIVTRDKKQLDGGCGLKNFTTISNALKSLEEMGCIESDKGTSTEGDPSTTVYRIRFRGTTPNVVPTTDNVVGVLRQTEDGYYSSRNTGTTPNVATRNSIQDTDKQETVQQEDMGAFAPPARAEISDLKEKVEVLLEDTEKRAAVKVTKGQTDGFSDRSAAGQHHGFGASLRGHAGQDLRDTGSPSAGADGKVPERDARRREADSPQGVAPAQPVRGASEPSSTHSTDGAATSALLSPSGNGSRASGAKIPKRPKAAAPVEPKGPPVMPAEDAEWTTRTCLQLFDAWRGAYLIGKFELMQASSCAKEMVAQYSRAEVTEAKARMDKDKYWMERGGADVCNVAKQIHRYCKRGKAPAQAAIDDDPYSFASILKRQEEQERAAARGN